MSTKLVYQIAPAMTRPIFGVKRLHRDANRLKDESIWLVDVAEILQSGFRILRRHHSPFDTGELMKQIISLPQRLLKGTGRVATMGPIPPEIYRAARRRPTVSPRAANDKRPSPHQ